MAVPFYLPEGGIDDTASSSSGASGSSSSGVSSSGTSDGTSSVASQSPNTTTSATQTPMQSPLTMPTDQVLFALCEWFQQHQRHYNPSHSARQIFQYPSPSSPSCSTAQSPNFTRGDVFFPPGGVLGRTPHTSVSFAAGEDLQFFQQNALPPSTPQTIPTPTTPQHHYSHSYPQQSGHLVQHYSLPPTYANATFYATYTPPPTPNVCNAATSTPMSGFSYQCPPLASSPLTSDDKIHLQCSQSDATRRKRITSTGKDEREFHSDLDTNWDDYDDRYDNFTAGQERLQEFNGRIPIRKKKISNSPAINNEHEINDKNNVDIRNLNQRQKPTERKKQNITWPTVVTVFVLAMGCGFLAAR